MSVAPGDIASVGESGDDAAFREGEDGFPEFSRWDKKVVRDRSGGYRYVLVVLVRLGHLTERFRGVNGDSGGRERASHGGEQADKNVIRYALTSDDDAARALCLGFHDERADVLEEVPGELRRENSLVGNRENARKAFLFQPVALLGRPGGAGEGCYAGEEVLAYLARQRAYRLLGRRQRDSLAVVKPARELSFFDDRGEVGGLERGLCFFFYK